MLEIPESYTIANQLNQTVAGKKIQTVEANHSPRGFAFYFGNPQDYQELLAGRTVTAARANGGQVEVFAGGARILFGDGANLRYFPPGTRTPAKHQLYLAFEDGSFLLCTVQMYGGIWAFSEGANDSNFYYRAAKEKPSPLTDAFDEKYFMALFQGCKETLSAKAFLATEQRIPGLGNGVLQDILFRAGVHPRTKLSALTNPEKEKLFLSIKETLKEMTEKGGRDTEKDLFGKPGGYKTLLSSKTYGLPCPRCGGMLEKKAYLGGNVYVCPVCQPLKE